MVDVLLFHRTQHKEVVLLYQKNVTKLDKDCVHY